MFTVESVESPELHDSSEFEEAVANHDHELTEEVQQYYLLLQYLCRTFEIRVLFFLFAEFIGN